MTNSVTTYLPVRLCPGLSPGVGTAMAIPCLTDPGRKPGAPGRQKSVLALVPFLMLVGAAVLSGQAVPRADLPPGGAVRLTIDPLISSWHEEVLNSSRRPMGWFLSGDSVGGAQVPQLARLNQDLAIATSTSAVVTNLGAAVLALRGERRVTPFGIEFGISDRFSLGVRVPLVRVQTRAGLTLDSTNSNLGVNPRGNVPGADSIYGAFFGDFDAAVTQLQQNIQGGSYGCPASPQCAMAQAFADSAEAIRDALRRAAYGGGPGDAAPFLPTTTSAVGVALGTNLTRIQQQFAVTWGVGGFDDPFLLPGPRATADSVQDMMAAVPPGFTAARFRDTPSRLRFWLGDVEVEARFRAVHSKAYTATIGAMARLPTGHPDSPHDFVDLSAGDAQLDLEGQLTQELRVGRLWLNAAARLGVQTPGERERRVGPVTDILLPRAATAVLEWDPGDYFVLDVAPLYRFNPYFAAGLTFGWSTQGEDRYTYRSAQDSVAIETAMGVPLAASLLNAGTDISRVRLGGAVTFTGPVFEGSFVFEKVINASGGWTPAQTRVRLVMRAMYQLF